MRRHRRAKIIATLGPATSNAAAIKALFKAGVDVFRLNFSHGDRSAHQNRFNIIRSLEKQYHRPVGILLDLQGPKLRVGKFENRFVELEKGQGFRLDLDQHPGNTSRVQLAHPEIYRAIKPGMALLLDDGKIRLKVQACSPQFVNTEVIVGGPLSNHKGVNVPDVALDMTSLTDKDHADLQFGLQLGVDWVALSFVQRPEDIIEARNIIAGRAVIMSKIEKPQAIDRLSEIVELSDAVMVARGDLGVECPPENVPGLQKKLVRVCREAGKPIVVATQMLDSMENMPTPTRAEASDVATAIFDGVDAVMLSAETAVGSYPIEAVTMMSKIILSAERDTHYSNHINLENRLPEATAPDAITAAARQVSQTISAACVVAFSTTGSTTLRLARERPNVPILGLTPGVDTARRMTLVWGVHSVQTDDCNTFSEMVDDAVRVSREENFSKTGDTLVITAGVPFGTPGATNVLRITRVE